MRGSIVSRGMQASTSQAYPRVGAPFTLSISAFKTDVKPSEPIHVHYHTPEEEIALGPACWLWDYLRRSKAGGFFLPLSGGIDSCATALIVYSMCRMVSDGAKRGGMIALNGRCYEIYISLIYLLNVLQISEYWMMYIDWPEMTPIYPVIRTSSASK